jgi:hypothetical protein
MVNLGFKSEAHGMARWLAGVQKENGSWDNFVFDTGMAIQGLRCSPEFEENIEKGKKFIEENFDKKEFTHPEVQIGINLLALFYAKIYDNVLPVKLYEEGAMLHFWAYILEAMINNIPPTNIPNYCKEYIDRILEFQKNDGSISAIYGQEWICYPAVAQMACLFYKCGYKEAGDKAIKYLESVQNEDGSFYGSNAEYF